MLEKECERTDHIDPSIIGDCPRCESKNIHIRESLKVYDYCEEIHLIDAIECLNCDAVISIDLLKRLEEAENKGE